MAVQRVCSLRACVVLRCKTFDFARAVAFVLRTRTERRRHFAFERLRRPFIYRHRCCCRSASSRSDRLCCRQLGSSFRSSDSTFSWSTARLCLVWVTWWSVCVATASRWSWSPPTRLRLCSRSSTRTAALMPAWRGSSCYRGRQSTWSAECRCSLFLYLLLVRLLQRWTKFCCSTCRQSQCRSCRRCVRDTFCKPFLSTRVCLCLQAAWFARSGLEGWSSASSLCLQLWLPWSLPSSKLRHLTQGQRRFGLYAGSAVCCSDPYRYLYCCG